MWNDREELIELMNREIDGLNSPKESTELQRELDRNPEAERYYRELLFVAGVLNRVPEVEPPAGLKESVLNSIFGREAGSEATAGARAVTGRPGRPASFLDVFRIRWEPRLAYVLAACAVVALFLFVLFWRVVPGRAPRDLEALYGSIVTGQEAGQLLAVEPIRFDAAGVGGELHVRYEAKRILAALDLHSDFPVQVFFDYSTDVTLENVTALSECQYSTKAGDGRFELTHSGDCRYVIVLRDGSGTHSPIAITVMSGETRLLEQTARPVKD